MEHTHTQCERERERRKRIKQQQIEQPTLKDVGWCEKKRRIERVEQQRWKLWEPTPILCKLVL